MNTKEALDLISILAQYGIPAVTELISTWSDKEVSLEDLKKLLDEVKDPEDF